MVCFEYKLNRVKWKLLPQKKNTSDKVWCGEMIVDGSLMGAYRGHSECFCDGFFAILTNSGGHMAMVTGGFDFWHRVSY